MVSDVIHLDTTISQRIKHEEDEKDDEDTISVSTASTDNCDGGAVVLQDAEDKAPCFQNIEVTNSSDVHFGNKTYYQGPVTIKQILYTNRDGDKSIETNGVHPQLAINDKCSEVNGVSYGNYNDGYTTDSSHHITNGHTKLPNGIHHDHYESFRGSGEKKISKTQGLLIGSGILIVVLLIVTGVTLALTLQGSNSMNSAIIDDPDAQGEVTMITRNEWVATDPVRAKRLSLPVPNIIFSDTLSENCTEKKDCIKYVRFLQNQNIEAERKDDIDHNFLIGGDGNVYQGRGWKVQPQIVPNCDTVSLSIAFIGTYTESNKLSKAQIVAAKRLIRTGVLKQFIRGNYRMIASAQLTKEGAMSTSLLEEIKTWPNYISTDYSNDITEREKFCRG